ncbi:acyltransferase family protein [Plantibacter sp. YIM 135347]|uniref:acyltransferase family protein n=1 Tax=Plantibacter sp. YIM 135347 TaxID=3423919 RepID=UPI003D3477CE
MTDSNGSGTPPRPPRPRPSRPGATWNRIERGEGVKPSDARQTDARQPDARPSDARLTNRAGPAGAPNAPTPAQTPDAVGSATRPKLTDGPDRPDRADPPVSRTAESAHPAPKPRTVLRRDIQGLRALAVIAVILNHVLLWPTGGFIGVDVFLVVSGFLITDLLLREHDRSGRVSLVAFFGRRIRRIFPAALTVLVATVALAFLLFNRPRAMSTVWDALSSLLFVSNWRFAAEGTDYFQAGNAVSPLQHFWSLSVEEQFYLVWPIVLVAVLALAVKLSRTVDRRRFVLGTVMLALVVASFGFAMWETATTPTVAYFSTLSRAWELGAGALLAIVAPWIAKTPALLRGLLGWAGLAGIVVACFVIGDATPFPGPWAALPVAATLLVILGGIGGTNGTEPSDQSAQRTLFPLTNPVSVWIGTISYSLYLWHFPVLVFVPMLLPAASTTRTLVVLGLIAVLSVLSFLLVEQPFHRSPWLQRFAGSSTERSDARRAAWTAWRGRFGSQFLLASFGVVILAGVVVIGAGPLRITLPGQAPIAPLDASADASARLQADLAAAVAATSWPTDLSPSLDDAIARSSNDNPALHCFEVGDTADPGGCTWGDPNAPNHMFVVGDSTALAYAPAFRAIAEASQGQWRVTTIGLYGCRFTDVSVQNDGAGVMDACQTRKQDITDLITADAPRLVVVSNAYALGQTPDRQPLSTDDLVAATAREAASYDVAGRIVYLAPPPLGADLGQCYSPVSSPRDCDVPVDAAWSAFATATEAAAAASGDHWISSLPFSCADGVCPAFAGTFPTKYDTVHLTPAYAEHIAGVIQQAFVAAGVM